MPNEIATQELRVLQDLPVGLNREDFLGDLLRELTGTLQDVVGVDEAAGFISIVGQRIGDRINKEYRAALGVACLTRHQVAQVLVDLKRRIGGDFFVLEEDDEKIVLGNRACPFRARILDRPSLCMMTSNVFGIIAAENLGYARVVIEEAIARGDANCRIIVYLRSTAEARSARGREYYRG